MNQSLIFCLLVLAGAICFLIILIKTKGGKDLFEDEYVFKEEKNKYCSKTNRKIL